MIWILVQAGGCRVGREPNGQKEHIRRGLQYRIDSSFLVHQEAEICVDEDDLGRVFRVQAHQVPSYQRLCAAEDHVTFVHSNGGSGC